MRRMTLLVGLVAVAGHSADRRSGTVDAGTTPDWKAKPVLLLTDDPAVVEQYVAAKPPARAAMKGVLTKITIGRRAMGSVLLEGYQLPFSRRVDLTADVTITDPTGRVVLEKASLAGARTLDPKTMLLVPLAPSFPLMFGLTDPEGEYRVRITVWDQVRGASTVLETKFFVSR